MNINNFNDFKDNLYQLRTYIIIPNLGIRVDKTQFIINGKYDTNAEEDYLRKIYEKNYK